MQYSESFLMGVIFGLLLIALAAVVAYLAARNKRRGKYDERQQIVRGKAYRYAFWVMVGYYVTYGFLSALDIRWCDELTGAFVGVLLGALTLGLVCVKNDAYIALNEQPGRVMLLLGIVAAVNLLAGLPNLIAGQCVTDGILNVRIVNTLCAAIVLMMMAAVIIKRLHDKKAEGQPHEEP